MIRLSTGILTGSPSFIECCALAVTVVSPKHGNILSAALSELDFDPVLVWMVSKRKIVANLLILQEREKALSSRLGSQSRGLGA